MRILAGVCYLLLYLLPGHRTASEQVSSSREYKVKAAFLFNFTRFVEWPADAFPAENAPLVISILGEDPFGAYLDQIVAGESVNGHPLVVKRHEKITNLGDCHILFIQETDHEKLAEILHYLKDRNILTVGEGEDFGQMGGMIGFVPNDDRIGMQINPKSARRADIVISSKLLRLAEIVTTKPNQ